MTKEQIQQLILTQQQKSYKLHKTTLLFVSHDIEEAVFLGEEILILHKDGTIQGDRKSIFCSEKCKRAD